MAKLDFLNQEFPELRDKLDFGEFHEELAGNYVEVWLNLSDEFQAEIEAHQKKNETYYERRDVLLGALSRDELPPDKREEYEAELEERQEAYHRRTADIYSRLWNCEPDEVLALFRADITLVSWLISRTWEMIGEYREGRKKARTGS